MAEGIIFGDYLLSKDDFIPLFEQFYEEKGQDFIQDLRLLKEKIDNMIEKDYTIAVGDIFFCVYDNRVAAHAFHLAKRFAD